MDKDYIKEPLSEALEILNKYLESVSFYNEVYEDKKEDPHVKFALKEEGMSFDMMSMFLRNRGHKKFDELYTLEISKAIDGSKGSIAMHAGTYLYDHLGRLHNNEGPAVVTKYGTEMYFNSGKINNGNGPAVIFKDTKKDFQVYIHYINNTLHKENGPAKEVWQDGKLYKSSYYINGRLHREDGPAIEWADGQFIYAVDGKKHKEDGPAVRIKDPFNKDKFKEEYWINGKQISSIEFKLKQMREKFFPKNQSENKPEVK